MAVFVPEYKELRWMGARGFRDYCKGVLLWPNVADVMLRPKGFRFALYLMIGGKNKKRAKEIVYRDFSFEEIDELRILVAELKNYYPSLIVENYNYLYLESLHQVERA